MKERYKDIEGMKKNALKVTSQMDTEYINKMKTVRSEIIKRDVTKRQMKIIDQIFIFSLAFGKDAALIPNLQDFQMCGVDKSKIKYELEKLVELNMISWDKEQHLFTIKNPAEWECPYHYGFSDRRIQELVFLNAKHKEEVKSIIQSD